MDKQIKNPYFEDLEIAEHVEMPQKKERTVRKNAFLKEKTVAVVLLFAAFVLIFADSSETRDHQFISRNPSCSIYPVLDGNDLSGTLYFAHSDTVVKAKYSVYETTQNRLLFEDDIPLDAVKSGRFYIPPQSFFNDYFEHFTEYSGFEGKGDYHQEIRVSIEYDVGNNSIQRKSLSAVPASVSLYWIKQAGKDHGSALVKDGYITEILHASETSDKVRECFIDQPERVLKTDTVSAHILLDGKELEEKAFTEKLNGGVVVIRIPVPEGMSADKTHSVDIYLTQYIREFKKGVEFLYTDIY